MSEVKVNKISPRSGTTVTLGDSGDTFTVPSGATFDASNATTTLPSTVVTTTGTQTLTNKTIDASQLTGTITPSDATVTPAKLDYNYNQYRNIFINGDMSIAQRGTSASSLTSSGYYTVDRFQTIIGSQGTWTQSQSTDVPSGQGFATSLKMDCTTADASPSASDRLVVRQLFEGQNLQYLKKGTANAISLTASFWVKSTKTGTFIVELFDVDNQRQISASYTVNTTNTWEKKTVTFAGDTTGALDNNNGESFQITFWLGAGTDYSSGTLNTTWNSNTNANRAVGQVNLADSTANEWYITGVQLEAGTSASDFEFLPYDVNLQRCWRYFEKIANGGEDPDAVIGSGGYVYQTNVLAVNYQWYPKRAAPSIYQTSGTNYFRYQRDGATEDFNSIKIYIPNYLNGLIYSDDGFIGTSGSNGWVQLNNNSSAYLGLNAEL